MFINELKEKRIILADQKHDLEFKCGQIKDKLSVSGRLPNDKYKVYVDARNKYKKKLLEITAELREINDDIKSIASGRTEPKEGNTESKRKERLRFVYLSLLDLKHQYHVFAADPTRISSMRQMAAEFANRIDMIVEESKNMSL
jgi:hypothetical protein